MAIEINVVNGIVNISTDGEVPRSYYGAVGASGSVMPMKAHLLGNVTEVSWVSAQGYSVPAGSWNDIAQSDKYSSTLGTGATASFEFVDLETGGTYISSIVINGTQNGKYKVGDSVAFQISYMSGLEIVNVQVYVTVKSLEYQRLLIKIGGDFYEVNWFDLIINGDTPTDFENALKLISSAFASVGSPYKVYSALLTQSGDQPPVATVLQNTIGDIVWTRDDVGTYVGTLSGAFAADKTFVILTIGGGNVCIANSMSTGINYVIINTNEPDSPNNPIDVDGMMQIEIRVYN